MFAELMFRSKVRTSGINVFKEVGNVYLRHRQKTDGEEVRGCQQLPPLEDHGWAALFGDRDPGLYASPLEFGLGLLMAIPILWGRS